MVVKHKHFWVKPPNTPCPICIVIGGSCMIIYVLQSASQRDASLCSKAMPSTLHCASRRDATIGK